MGNNNCSPEVITVLTYEYIALINSNKHLHLHYNRKCAMSEVTKLWLWINGVCSTEAQTELLDTVTNEVQLCYSKYWSLTKWVS